jgi:homoserine kinase
VLPDTISMRDGVFNLQRALLLIHALQSGSYGDVREALRDRWHQPARAPLVPGLPEALALEDAAVLGACLSGAGPSIVLFTQGQADQARRRLEDIYRDLGVPSTIRVLQVHQ